jgi:integrase
MKAHGPDMANGNIETLYNGTTVVGYKVRWYEHGKRPGKTFGPKEKALAERYLTEVRSRSPKRRGRTAPKPVAPVQISLTLEEFYALSYQQTMHTSKRKGQTRSASDLDSKTGIWKKWIQPNLGSKALNAITAADIEALYMLITHRDWENDPTVPASWKTGEATAKKASVLLNDIFGRAIVAGKISSNPASAAVIHLPAQGEVDMDFLPQLATFTDEQVALIIANTPDRYKPLVRTLSLLGIRIGEAAALRVQDIDLDRKVMHIRASLSRKSRKHQNGVGAVRKEPKTKASRRSIEIPDVLIDDLRQLMHRQSPTAALFRGSRGGLLNAGNFRRREWLDARIAAGITHAFTPHDLRHYVASRMLEDGVNPQMVCDLLGHAHVGITQQIYRHAMNTEVAGAATYWNAKMERKAS